MLSFELRSPVVVTLQFTFSLSASEIPKLRWRAVGQEAWPNFLDAPQVPYFRLDDIKWYLSEMKEGHLHQLVRLAGGVESLEVIATTFDPELPFGHALVVVPGADNFVLWRSNSGRSLLRTVRWNDQVVMLEFRGTLSALRRLGLPLFEIE